MALIKQSSRSVAKSGPVDLKGFGLEKDGSYCITLADGTTTKYSFDGKKLWTRTLGYSPKDYGPGIKSLADGSIYVNGATRSPRWTEPTPEHPYEDYDGFIIKYNNNGSKAWESKLATPSFDTTHAVLDGDSYVYALGFTEGNLDGQNIENQGDLYIAKFNSNGSQAWIRQEHSSGYEDFGGADIAKDGSVYLAGTTDGSMNGQQSNGGKDIFITKYNTNGERLWLRQFGSTGDDEAQNIVVATDGSVYIVGKTNGSLDEQQNSGKDDIFIAKYSANGDRLWTRVIGSSLNPMPSGTVRASITIIGDVIYVTHPGYLDASRVNPPLYSFIAKYNLSGEKQWEQTSSIPNTDVLMGLKQLTDGSLVGLTATKLPGGNQTSGYSTELFLSKYIETPANLPTSIGSSSATSSKTTTLATGISQLYLTGDSAINGTGNVLDNYIQGNDAKNILDGGFGNDYLAGGKGDDTYIVDSRLDTILELANEGIDTVKSSVSWDLGNNIENLILTGSAITGTGNSLNNVITGNGLDNIIDGGGGNDSMNGGAGNDIYYVDSLGDSLIDSSGNDSVYSNVSWTLGSGLENLNLTGSDPITGIGNTLNNRIIGNSSNNFIDGKGGTDWLTGGGGADTFRISVTPKFGITSALHLTDFNTYTGDILQLSKSAFGLSSNATPSIVKVGNSNYIGTLADALASSNTFVFDSTSGYLYWNQNGTKSGFGSGGVFAIVDNVTVSAGSFIDSSSAVFIA